MTTIIWVIIILYIAYIVRDSPTALMAMVFLIAMLPTKDGEETWRIKRNRPQKQKVKQPSLKKRR